MRITEYPKIKALDKNNVILIDGSGGTSQITCEDFPYAIGSMIDVTTKNLLFRGKNLGGVVTEDQRAAIQNGTFTDLCLGDFWEINGVKWRIADFDYWYQTGDSPLTRHHVVIVPDSPLYLAKMNDSSTSNGGYVNSRMYTEYLANAKSMIAAAFSSNLISHRELLTTNVFNGYPSEVKWMDSTIDLMNEMMVFGAYILTPASTGATLSKRYTNSSRQLSLFRVHPLFINTNPERGRISYWLRDIASSVSFVIVSDNIITQDIDASLEVGVRPAFAIG